MMARQVRFALLTPPVAGGVKDYARLVARDVSAEVLEFVDGRSIDENGREASADLVYIQYSGYGYDKRGAPAELLRWAREQHRRGTRIGVFFHELFASGPPWTSAFWMSSAQQHVAAELARIADFWLTNRHASASWLARRSPPKPSAVLATPSNVGELDRYSQTRSARVVVFGSADVRDRTYREGGDAFLDFASTHRIAVHDIGQPLAASDLTARLSDAGVTFLGRLDAAEVSRELAQAQFGALAYPVDFAAKSSVLAAYCAHGACPILFSADHSGADGLAAGINYVSELSRLEPDSESVATIAKAGFDWYQDHRLSRHGEALRQLAELQVPA